MWRDSETVSGPRLGARLKGRKPRVVRVSARGARRGRWEPRRLAALASAPLLLLAAAGLLWFGLRETGRALFSRNDRYRIRYVDVQAASTRTKTLAREYTQLREGMNLFAFDAGKVRDYVMQHAPNFRSLTISRRLPDTVVIEVVERMPLVRLGRNGDVVADADGQVFIQRSGLASLPALHGVDMARLRPGGCLEGQALAALRVVEACESPAFDMRVQWVDADHPDHVLVRLEYAGRVREIKLAWEGMGREGGGPQRALLRRLHRVKEALDSPRGRDMNQLDATLEDRLFGK
jgi:hypothetical protein